MGTPNEDASLQAVFDNPDCDAHAETWGVANVGERERSHDKVSASKNAAIEHIRLLTGSADTPMHFRFFADSGKALAIKSFGTVAECWPEIERRQADGSGVFFVVNPGGNTDAEITAVRALFVDADGVPKPTAWHLEPDLVTSRDETHWHAYWCIADMPVAEFKEAQQRLAAYYGTDPAICNPSRVMRLAGTTHLKDPAHPRLVELTPSAEELAPASLEDVLAELPAREKEPRFEKPPVEREQADAQAASDRKPVAEIVLRETLSYIDPPADEPGWRRIIAAIKASPLLDGDGEKVAIDWSAGQLDRTGKYASVPPPNWGGDDVVRAKYKAAKAEKPGGTMAGFGTIVYEARRGGMPGNRIPHHWLEHAIASDHQPGPFLLTMSDVFAWPDPTELVHDFLMQGEDACIYSPPKCGKTFVALDIALSLAAGLPVFGKLNVLRPGEAVVYLSGEGHAGMKRRILAWGQAHGLTREQVEGLPFFYKTDVPASAEGNADAMRYVDGIRQFCTPVLVVIDTMARSLGKLDESTSASAALYLDVTKALRDAFNCTTLTLAHEGKTEGKGVRGSSAFVAGFDAVWHLDANKDNRTAMLEAEWLKDAEDLGPHCFRVETVYVEGMENGKGAVLRWIDIASHKPGKDAREASGALLFQIRALLSDRGIHDQHSAWTHSVVAEHLMPTPRPPKDENSNIQLEWETGYRKLYTRVANAIRGNDAKQMGDRHVIEGGRPPVWVWYLPRG